VQGLGVTEIGVRDHLVDRAADCGRDHFDHCGHRHSKPASLAHGVKRGFGSWSLLTINTAEVTYSTTYPRIGFASRTSLGGAAATCATATGATSTGACLIDDVLATTAVKSGYGFMAAGRYTGSYLYFDGAAERCWPERPARVLLRSVRRHRYSAGGTTWANTAPAL